MPSVVVGSISVCTELEKSCILSMQASTSHMESPSLWWALGLSGGDGWWSQPARWGLPSQAQAQRDLGSQGLCVKGTLGYTNPKMDQKPVSPLGKCDSQLWWVNGIGLVLETCELDVWTQRMKWERGREKEKTWPRQIHDWLSFASSCALGTETKNWPLWHSFRSL